MLEEATAILVDGLVLVGYFLLTVGMAAAGMLFEYRSFASLSVGDTVFAVWAGGMGLVLLAFASKVARDKFADAYREFRGSYH